jgi:hypothetical protein
MYVRPSVCLSVAVSVSVCAGEGWPGSAAGGCLFDLLVDSGGFPEPLVAAIMQRMLQAVAYLHSIGMVHRDIKVKVDIHTTDRHRERETHAHMHPHTTLHCTPAHIHSLALSFSPCASLSLSVSVSVSDCVCNSLVVVAAAVGEHSADCAR